MDYVNEILKELDGAVEAAHKRSENFKHAGGMEHLVELLRSVDKVDGIQDRIADSIATQSWVGAIPKHEPVSASFEARNEYQKPIVGIDGSQIYPNSGPVIWAYAYATSWGGDEQIWSGQFFGEDQLLDDNGYVENSYFIDEWRGVHEARVLRKVFNTLWGRNYVILMDGSMFPWQRNRQRDSRAAEEFRESIAKSRGLIAAVTSSPASRYLIHLLRLAAGEEGKSKDFVKHVRDRDLVNKFLPVGHRSAVFLHGNPQNILYQRHKAEIWMFYIRTSRDDVLRIEVPGWVAMDQDAVDAIHASILIDTRGLGYPVCLSYAHDQAVIRKGVVEDLQKQAIYRYTNKGHMPPKHSAKDKGKGIA